MYHYPLFIHRKSDSGSYFEKNFDSPTFFLEIAIFLPLKETFGLVNHFVEDLTFLNELIFEEKYCNILFPGFMFADLYK